MRVLSSRQIPDSVIIPPGRLLLAFSGGSDSLFLMYVLSRLAAERTEAVYVDHAIRPRPELEAEIALNMANAAKLGIPLRVERIGDGEIAKLSRLKGTGTEAAARELRYSVLRSIAENEGFDHILTAHHREDQVETVLMRMLHSSPFYSYQGILREDGLIFRPLLSVPKREIMEGLEASSLRWSEDSTNSDTGYLRNSVRHGILPFVSEAARESIAAIAASAAELRRRFPPVKVVSGYYSAIERSSFLSAFPMRQEEAIYSALSAAGQNGRVPRSLVRDIVRNAEKGTGHMEAGEALIYFSRTDIKVYPRLDDFAVDFSTLIHGGVIKPSGLRLSEEREDDLTLIVDTKKLVLPAVLRTAREGDRIVLRNGEKLLSDLMKDLRVPYAVVLEDREGIAAFFSRFAGGRDRLSKRFLGLPSGGSALAIRPE